MSISDNIKRREKILEHIQPSLEKARDYMTKQYFDEEVSDLGLLTAKVYENVKKSADNSITIYSKGYNYVYYLGLSTGEICPPFPGVELQEGFAGMKRHVFTNATKVTITLNNGSSTDKAEFTVEAPGFYQYEKGELTKLTDENQWRSDLIQTMTERARSFLSEDYFSDRARPLNEVMEKINQMYGFVVSEGSLTPKDGQFGFPSEPRERSPSPGPNDTIMIHSKRSHIHFWSSGDSKTGPPEELPATENDGYFNFLFKGTSATFAFSKDGVKKGSAITIKGPGEYWISDDDKVLKTKPRGSSKLKST